MNSSNNFYAEGFKCQLIPTIYYKMHQVILFGKNGEWMVDK